MYLKIITKYNLQDVPEVLIHQKYSFQVKCSSLAYMNKPQEPV